MRISFGLLGSDFCHHPIKTRLRPFLLEPQKHDLEFTRSFPETGERLGCLVLLEGSNRANLTKSPESPPSARILKTKEHKTYIQDTS